MFLASSLLIVLYLWAIVRAITFFRLTGEARDTDKIMVASIIAASVMFIIARVMTFITVHGDDVKGYPVELWLGFGFFNVMFYLGYLHLAIEYRRDPGQRRQQPLSDQLNVNGEPQ